MKTISARNEDVQRNWFLVDASGETLGRLASEVAHRLRGKHKSIYTPHVDTGDYIVVVNAAQVKVTGNKLKDKIYHRHSGYPGGLKSIALGKLLDKKPEQAIELAVKGMLPRNPLGRAMLKKLKVYGGAEHPHGAQQPLSWQPGATQPAESLQKPALNVVEKAPARKAPAKPAPAKKAAAGTIALPSGKKIKQDDLKAIEGIGPKIAELLIAADIGDWATLAKAEPEAIRAILAEAGSRYTMHDPETWPRQAQLCVDESWQELVDYQDALDGGKETE